MTIDAVVERLCRLPADFYAGSKSMVQLVGDSGIDACPAALSVEKMLQYMTGHSDIVESWLLWSANKRVTSGWYFSRRGDRFDVGFHPQGELTSFTDRDLACAEFMVREIKALLAIRRSINDERSK